MRLRSDLRLGNVAYGLPPFGWGLDMDFTKGAMPTGVSFSRASGGGRTNADRLSEWVGVDVPRFDYHPVTGACLGLLMEESRTNLLSNSQALAAGSWSGPANGTVTNNGAVGLDGAMSATAWTENTAQGERVRTQGVNVTSGTQYVVWVVGQRIVGARHMVVLTESAANFGPGNAYAVLNMDTGVIAQASGTNRSAGALHLGGGRWLLWMSLQAIGTGLNGFRVGMTNSPTNAFPNYIGDGLSAMGILASDVEVGAFPTSYIPTTTGPVTRLADYCRMTGTNFTRWYNPLEGTFMFQIGSIGPSGARIVGGVGDTFDNCMYISGAGNVSFRSGGADQALLGLGALAAGDRIAFCYKANRFAASKNGGAVVTDTAGAVPIGPIRLSIGSDPWSTIAGNSINGHVARVRYYPRALTDAQIQQEAAAA